MFCHTVEVSGEHQLFGYRNSSKTSFNFQIHLQILTNNIYDLQKYYVLLWIALSKFKCVIYLILNLT